MNRSAKRSGWVHRIVNGEQVRIHMDTQYVVTKRNGVWNYPTGKTRHFYRIVRGMNRVPTEVEQTLANAFAAFNELLAPEYAFCAVPASATIQINQVAV